MKLKVTFYLILGVLLLLPRAVLAQTGGTAFNYQGQLFDSGGLAVNDQCDFNFKLYDSQTAPVALAIQQLEAVTVSEGLFSVTIDFGGAVFDGADRWLEPQVRCGTVPGFDSLGRQPIRSTPYAIYAYGVDWANVRNKPVYSAAAGLSLTGTQFSLLPAYRLPQGCSSNEIPQWAGDDWICAAVSSVDAYSKTEVDEALAQKLDAADFAWSGLSGMPAGFADGTDATDDTVSWAEISGLIGTGAANVAAGNHDHDAVYYTQQQVDETLAQKIDATDVYTTGAIDSWLAAKIDASEVYTTTQIDEALAQKLDAADFAWSGLTGIPAGFADGTDATDDTVSWSEISGLVGTGTANVAGGNHNHDAVYYTQQQVDTALAQKIDATGVYTTAQIDNQIVALQTDIGSKIDASEAYTTAQVDEALALKLDTTDFTWSGLAGMPAGFADGTDAIDDTVSWSEISGLIGTGAANVPAGNHNHDAVYYTQPQVDETLAQKIDATDVYTTGAIDSWLAAKIDASEVYTITQIDGALARKLDTTDFTWSGLAGIPAGFADGTDAIDDTVSWSEISGLVGTGTANVAAGDHDHDDIYYTQPQVDEALAQKIDATKVYTTSAVDLLLAAKIDVSDAYTIAQVDGQINDLQTDIDSKIDANEVYTTTQIDAALAQKLDAADFAWSRLTGIPTGFADGVDATDDTVSWAEISSIVGTGATNVAAGDHDHDAVYYTQQHVDEVLAQKIDATEVYTTGAIDLLLAAKIDASEVYTTAQVGDALAQKLDAADFVWSGLAGIPEGFADGTDDIDDTVSWSEISGLVGIGVTHVAAGNHDHDAVYYTQLQVDEAFAQKIDATEVYTTGAIDLLLATKMDASEVYTTAQIDNQLAALQAGIDSKIDASEVYTTAQVDEALAQKLDAADFAWSGLTGIPVGFADGADAIDDTVSWAEISGIVGTGTTNVAGGSHTHTYADPLNGAGIYWQYKPNNTACAANDILKWDTTNQHWVCGPASVNSGDITGVTAGSGLTGGGTAGTVTLGASFGGTGSAVTIARSDHNHDSRYWAVSGTAASAGDFIGTTSSQPLVFKTNNLVGLRLQQGSGMSTEAPAVIGGYAGNTAGAGAVVGGGGESGLANGAEGSYSVIGGGSGNTTGSGSTFTTVGGGYGNTADGYSATVGGGYENTASGYHTTIGGGWGNSASEGATVGGGTNNMALIYGSTIAGGTGNVTSGGDSTIAGGSGNVTGGSFAFVGGGNNNQATGSAAAIGGGTGNNASGMNATVAGGIENTAAGNYTFAAGARAKANHQGAFVWGDSTAANIASAANNSVTFRASGGYRLFSNAAATTGVSLAAGGGSWASLSDRNQKENLAPVDTQAVLYQVGRLPLSTWNYRSQPDDIRHIGPMAQDFYAAFGVGENDTTITALDGDGVSLAAIQALYERVVALEARVAELEAAP